MRFDNFARATSILYIDLVEKIWSRKLHALTTGRLYMQIP